MKTTNVKFLVVLLISLFSVKASAHDIEVKNSDGVTIYYNYINNNSELAVSYRGSWFDSYSDRYSGSVVIPKSVTYNGKIYSVTSIGGSAFYGCSGLTSVTIPNSVTSIGNQTFYDCSGLTSITIPNSVTSIGKSAFYGCSGLTSVTIPNSVTSIESYAFADCSGLTSVTIPNSVTSIGYGAFYGCSGLTSVTIPNSVTSIGVSAFYYCSGLTSITIPNSVTSIGERVFEGCRGLTSITIPNSVTSIGFSAFYGCSGLTSVTIPNSVTSIGRDAFYGCNKMKTVYSEIKSPFDINDNSFDANTYAGILYVPANTRALYKNRNGWKNFKNIEEKEQTFVLSILASGNGSAAYAGTAVRGTTRTFEVIEGTTATITFTPDDGYRVASVKVNGTDVTSSVQNGQYTIINITANTSLEVIFEEIPPTIYALTITATGNGSASYAGTTVRGTTSKFDVGTTATITFTPDDGYRIASVKVNGTDVTSGVQNGQYTMSNITANTNLVVTFEAKFPVPDYVDLGLPSGVRWAKWNMGSSSELDVPNTAYARYGWGDPTGEVRSANPSAYAAYEWNWQSQKDISGSKYDIASVQWGDKWRIPTPADFNEISETSGYTTWEYGNWADGQGNGYPAWKVTSVKYPDRYIYFPAAGLIRTNGVSDKVRDYAYYWTSVDNGYGLAKYAELIRDAYMVSADYGTQMPIRPVYGKPGEFAPQVPVGTLNWDGRKNANYWYAKDSHVECSGFTEIHTNVYVVEDVQEPQAISFKQTVQAYYVGNEIVKFDSASLSKFITIENKPYDGYANLSLALKFILGANKEFKGIYDGKVVDFVCVLADSDRKLQVYRKDDATKAKQDVAKLVYTTTTTRDSINKVNVEYIHTDYAEALLNYKAHNELADDVLTAYLAVKARYKDCPFVVNGDPINVRFLRPINVENKNATVEDAATSQKQIIYLRDLVNLSDWREEPFKTNYWYYYNIKSIEVVGVPDGGLLSENEDVLTNMNQAVDSEPETSLQAVSNLVEFKYFKAAPGVGTVPALAANTLPGQADYGRIEYTNLGSTVQKFKVRVPIKVVYEWGGVHTAGAHGAIFTTVDFEIEKNCQQQRIINFADANVKAISVANWDTNGDGELSEDEAAVVTDIGTIFANNENIVSFDELQYFVGLASIKQEAFSWCSGLTSITIPNSVTTIQRSAFYYCSGLTSVTIPNSVTSIGSFAFYNCSSLTSVTIPNSLTSIGHWAFHGCSGLTSVTIPNSLTSIEDGAFEGCSGLTSVTIPNSVTSIGAWAFSGCSGLTNVTIPNSLTSIEAWVFSGCSGLTSITIPNSVTSIGEQAFHGCNNMKTVYSEIESPFDINDNSFGANTYAGILYVPANTIDLYKNRNGWKNFKNIKQAFALSILVSGNGSASYAGTAVRGTTITFDVTEGTTATITFTPDDGYFLASVMVNGTNVTSSLQNGQYTISNITANTSLVVTFNEIPSTLYNLNITASGNGSASYAGTTIRGTTRKFEVYEGATAGIIFTPDEGYRIASVKVNGTDVTSGVQNGQYVINEVNDNISIEVLFVKIPSNFTDNGMNYAVTSFGERQVKVTGGNYGIVLTVPATVTFQDETWKVTGIENGMLANNSQLAAVIWEPEAVFTEHVSNPNLLLYVKSAGYAPAGIRNVVVDGVANNIVLTDATNGNDFYCPQAFTASRISYTHNYSMTTGIGEAKGWESIALPFDVAKTVHASKGEMVPYQTWDGTDSKKPYWLMELGAGGFVNANAIKANTPYIISMPNHPNYREDYRLNGSVTFSAENVRVARTDDVEEARQGDRHFVPNFANRQGTGVYALNVNSDYVTYTGGLVAGSRFVPNLRTLHPFEAYMTSTATTRMPIVIGDNMATGIAEVPAMIDERAVIRVYLPSGQLVVAEKDKSLDEVKAQLPAGVYIVNGQKLIIK